MLGPPAATLAHTMAGWALGLCLGYVAVVFGVRSVLRRRTAGSTGWVRGFGATPAERVANALFLSSCALDLLAPALLLAGALRPIAALDRAALHALGFLVFAAAVGGASSAQSTMGAAWRTGIDPSAPPVLVTAGLFRLARHPVYTTMVTSSLGVALLVPTVLAAMTVPMCLIALEIQTRLVEEPFLIQRHGRAYLDYARTVGRFLPRLGRIRPQE